MDKQIKIKDIDKAISDMKSQQIEYLENYIDYASISKSYDISIEALSTLKDIIIKSEKHKSD